jgi:bifunctional UDP-N-acetylglucosamine pyrophosphorylase/glucosamine-1-phosphate N-acetyltransferase
MNTNHISIVIMGAGKGTRMNSALPKVLHELGGVPMIERVVQTAKSVKPNRIVVITGYGNTLVERCLKEPKPTFAFQNPQLGTGHAVQQALPHLPSVGVTVILNGDTPLIKAETIKRLITESAYGGLVLLTTELEDPTGYGRIVRSVDHRVFGIVEEKDATANQKKIREVYTGMMAVATSRLHYWLPRLSNQNAQGEYYLTDIVEMATRSDVVIKTVAAETQEEVMGVNTPQQLALLESFLK